MFLCTCLHMHMSVLEERNENEKFEYILITPIRKNLPWGKSGPISWGYFTIYIIVVFPQTDYEEKVALSVGDISQYTL